MKLLDLQCKKCNAPLKIVEGTHECVCEYCGAKLLIDEETQKVEIVGGEKFGYEFESGRRQAALDWQAQQAEQTRIRIKQEKTSKFMGTGIGTAIIFFIYVIDKILHTINIASEAFSTFGVGVIFIALIASFVIRKMKFFNDNLLGIKILWALRSTGVLGILVSLVMSAVTK